LYNSAVMLFHNQWQSKRKNVVPSFGYTQWHF